MANEEQVNTIIEQLKTVRGSFLKRMDKTNAGMGHLLRYLSHMDRPVSAGEISASMRVSTARVAVLLKSMEEKGLIVRENDPADARKTLVKISDTGKAYMETIRADMFTTLSEVIDKVGYERMTEFVNTVQEINEFVAEKFEKKGNNNG